MSTTTQPIVVERTYNAPIERVWSALTDSAKMKQWYFDIKDFEPRVGFEFSFAAGSDCRQYLHLCKVTAVIPNRKLAYTWAYEDVPEIVTLVTFDLFEEGDKTRVRVTHEGTEQFPADNKDFARSSFTEGWTSILGKGLKEFVEK